MSTNIQLLVEDDDPERFALARALVIQTCEMNAECRDTLSSDWVSADVEEANVLVIAHTSEPETTVSKSPLSRFKRWLLGNRDDVVHTIPSTPRVAGFIAANVYDDTRLFIHTMYAHHVGGVLLNKLIQWGQSMGYTEIALNAIPSAVGFYMRYGFHFQSEDGAPALPYINEQPISPGEGVPPGLHLWLVEQGAYSKKYNQYHMVRSLLTRSRPTTLRSLVQPNSNPHPYSANY